MSDHTIHTSNKQLLTSNYSFTVIKSFLFVCVLTATQKASNHLSGPVRSRLYFLLEIKEPLHVYSGWNRLPLIIISHGYSTLYMMIYRSLFPREPYDV